MNKNSKIYVAGHNGMVGSAIVRKLKFEGFENLILKTHQELDLTNQQLVELFFKKEKPEFVFLAAAKVGGIYANSIYKGDFIYQNLMIESNIINYSKVYGVEKLLFLGSSCIYPKLCPQPIKEEYLLTSSLEETNDAYAISKIAGIKMCQSYASQFNCNFISVMPTNLFGPNDNYDLSNSHVLPALIRKVHEAKINNYEYVEVWGSGKHRREFLFVDDLADACYFLMNNYNSSEIINIGCGSDLTINELVSKLKNIIGYLGGVKFNSDKPDGVPQKLLDVSKINNLGWIFKTSLERGIKISYNDFLDRYEK